VSVKSQSRFVNYRVTRHPDLGEVTMAATCLALECRWSTGSGTDPNKAQDAMIKHTAETGHAVYSRFLADTAVCVLADKAEQDLRAEANQRKGDAP
jgi:hypothetical protein